MHEPTRSDDPISQALHRRMTSGLLRDCGSGPGQHEKLKLLADGPQGTSMVHIWPADSAGYVRIDYNRSSYLISNGQTQPSRFEWCKFHEERSSTLEKHALELEDLVALNSWIVSVERAFLNHLDHAFREPPPWPPSLPEPIAIEDESFPSS